MSAIYKQPPHASHAALVQRLLEASEISTNCVGHATEHLGRIVAVTMEQVAELPVLRELSAQDARLQAISEQIEVFTRESIVRCRTFDAHVARALEQARALARAVVRLERICTAWETLLILTRIETSRQRLTREMDDFSGQQEALIQETRALALTLHTLSGQLLRALSTLETGGREINHTCRNFNRDYNQIRADLDAAKARQDSAIDRLALNITEHTAPLLEMSRDTISILQFQDPMLQRLQRVDAWFARWISLTQAEDVPPLRFEPNLAHRLEANDEPEPAAGQPGELIFL